MYVSLFVCNGCIYLPHCTIGWSVIVAFSGHTHCFRWAKLAYCQMRLDHLSDLADKKHGH